MMIVVVIRPVFHWQLNAFQYLCNDISIVMSKPYKWRNLDQVNIFFIPVCYSLYFKSYHPVNIEKSQFVSFFKHNFAVRIIMRQYLHTCFVDHWIHGIEYWKYVCIFVCLIYLERICFSYPDKAALSLAKLKFSIYCASEIVNSVEVL